MEQQIKLFLELTSERESIGDAISDNHKKLSKLNHLDKSDYVYFIGQLKKYDDFLSDYGFYREHKTYIHKVTGQRIRLNNIITDSGLLYDFKKYNTKNPDQPTYKINNIGDEHIPNYIFHVFSQNEKQFEKYLALNSKRKELQDFVNKLDRKIKKIRAEIKSQIESDFVEQFIGSELLNNGFNLEQLLDFLNNLKESLPDYEFLFSTKNFFQTNDLFNIKDFKLIDKKTGKELSFEESIYRIFKATKNVDTQYTLYEKYKPYIINFEFNKLFNND
tara:strand:- start:199 stop:1023 length:825 start_codon:yes stop_codon:yes gene_type:complete